MMKKVVCAALICALMLCGTVALGENIVTAESLLAGNDLGRCLSMGQYTRQYVSYYDAAGEVCGYNDIIYKRDGMGYNTLVIYPANDGQDGVGAELTGGNFYATFEAGVPTYDLYASPAYATAGSQLTISPGAYIAYPAMHEGLELKGDDAGNYVVTAALKGDKCDQSVVAANGHDVTAADTVYNEFVYDHDTMALLSETLYYERDGVRRVCEYTTYEYGVDGSVYEQYASGADMRTLSVVLEPGTPNQAKMSFNVRADGKVRFNMNAVLYSDEACTQAVQSEGDCAAFTQETYYAR